MIQNKYISVNEHFKTSINIDFDLFNKTKIDEYIPTTDICDVLTIYLKSILGKEKNKATTLVGPYGKGKSFLLLVLLYLVGGERKNSEYQNLLQKIKKISIELFGLIEEVNNKEIKLLPIIINSNYYNINQAFLLGAKESLERNDLEKLIPNTVFDVCIEMINKWEKDTDISNKVIEICRKKLNINFTELKNSLKLYTKESYDQFESIYNCITNGLPFNSLINDDIVKLYKGIAFEINKFGYSGIFIVFDEFSKFIESNVTSLSREIKIVQDFAESCANSSINSQMHLCCVIHKSLSLYSQKREDTLGNVIKTVSGRFKEIKFNRSLDENFELISSAILKKDGFKCYYKSIFEKKVKIYTEFSFLSIFPHEFRKICEDVFPLNPLTAYELIRLSELVAQNERTLFTFLSDDDRNSLKSYLFLNTESLLNSDSLYDYFKNVFQNDENEGVRNIWLKCEVAFEKAETDEEWKILKALSIILMISDYEKLSPLDNYISMSLELSEEVTTRAISALIKKHVLKRNVITNYLTFATINSEKIDDLIAKEMFEKHKNFEIETVISSIYEKKYYLPRRHNENRKITRFYKSLFITEKKLSEINSFDLYFEDNYYDGIIFHLIRKSNEIDHLVKHFNEIAKFNIILIVPSCKLLEVIFNETERYSAIETLFESVDDDHVKPELNLLLQEKRDEMSEFYTNIYTNDFTAYHGGIKVTNLIDTLNNIMDKIYTKELIFNNELINKNLINVQYQKPSNTIIRILIEKEDFEKKNFSATSPETTIYNSIVKPLEYNEELRNVIEEIKLFIRRADEKKYKLFSLYDKLQKPPYGIRRGILPILFAMALNELNDNVILFLGDKEIDLNEENITKSVNNLGNKNYFIFFSRESSEKLEYLNKLLVLFNILDKKSFRKNTKELTDSIRHFFLGQPKLIRESNEMNNVLNLSKEFLQIKQEFIKFDINSFEILYSKIPSILNFSAKYDDIVNKLSDIIQEPEILLNSYKQIVSCKIKDAFFAKRNETIKVVVNLWLGKNNQKLASEFLEQKEKNLVNILKSITFEDSFATEEISRTIVGFGIEDWNRDYSLQIYDFIRRLQIKISKINTNLESSSLNIKEIIQKYPIKKVSSLAYNLKNLLEGILDEFNNAVPNDEIANVLLEILKGMI